jgi:hypothetical protein
MTARVAPHWLSVEPSTFPASIRVLGVGLDTSSTAQSTPWARPSTGVFVSLGRQDEVAA